MDEQKNFKKSNFNTNNDKTSNKNTSTNNNKKIKNRKSITENKDKVTNSKKSKNQEIISKIKKKSVQKKSKVHHNPIGLKKASCLKEVFTHNNMCSFFSSLNFITLLVVISMFSKSYFFSVVFKNSHYISLLEIATIFSVILFLVSFSFLSKGYLRMLYLSVVNLFFTIPIILNIWYFRFAGYPLPIYDYNILRGSSSQILKSAIYFINLSDFLLIFDILLIFFLYVLFSKKIISSRSVYLFISFFIVSLLLFVPISIEKNNQGGSVLDVGFFSKNQDVVSYTPLFYTFLEILREIRPIPRLNEEEILTIEEFLKNYSSIQGNTSNINSIYSGLGRGKNLIFIEIESVNLGVYDFEWNGVPIMPFLKKLAQEGIEFRNFYAQNNHCRTADVDFISQTSLYPLQVGCVSAGFQTNYFFSLARLLKSEGYVTYVMHGNNDGTWRRNILVDSLGFDKFYSKRHYTVGEKMGWGIQDREFFEQSVDILNNSNKPFYSFMITVTNHHPFTIYSHLRSPELEDAYPGTMLNDYFQTVRYTDGSIENFVNLLNKSGLLNDTILVIYGDHHVAPEFGLPPRARREEVLRTEGIDGMLIDQRVPLIIYNPEFPPLVVDTFSGQIDLLPTVADIMGVPVEKYREFILGRNIISNEEGFVIMPNTLEYLSHKELNSTEEMSKYEKRIKAINISETIIRHKWVPEIVYDFGINIDFSNNGTRRRFPESRNIKHTLENILFISDKSSLSFSLGYPKEDLEMKINISGAFFDERGFQTTHVYGNGELINTLLLNKNTANVHTIEIPKRILARSVEFILEIECPTFRFHESDEDGNKICVEINNIKFKSS